MTIVIAIAIAVAGMLAIATYSFIAQRWSNARGDRLEKKLETFGEEIANQERQIDAYKDNERTLHENADGLLKEISDLHTSNETLETTLASVQKAHDNLTRLLQDHPGALAPAIRSALDRLREEVSAAASAVAPAASGDPGGGEARPVHARDDLEHP